MKSSPTDKHSRAPSARMFKIHTYLMQGSYPNCTKLMEILGTSRKTVLRDIEFMLDSYQLPVAYDNAKRGYYYTEEVHSFPLITVTEGEMMALLIGQKALEQYRGTPLGKTLETAFKKITDQLTDEITFDASDIAAGVSFRTVGTTQTEVETFERLAKAGRERREVTLHYRKLGSPKVERRRIQPYHLACIENCWYSIAFDPLKMDMRKFALPRIKSLVVENTRFVRDKDFSAEKYFGESFGVFTGGKNHEVAIQFDRFGAALIRERIWHKTQKITEKAGGKLVLTLQVPRFEELQTWVLSWGTHAKVLRPADFATSVRNEARAAAAQYGRRAS